MLVESDTVAGTESGATLAIELYNSADQEMGLIELNSNNPQQIKFKHCTDWVSLSSTDTTATTKIWKFRWSNSK